MINYQTITIDLQPDYREPVVQMYLSERDVGRPIQVNVLMQGQPYSFTAGTTVHIDLRKPSGHVVQVNGNYAVGSNVVLFNVVEQMAAEPGMCLTELSIVGDGQDPIGSKNWLTKVELSPMHAGDPSETWIEDLDELVQDAMEGHIDATLSIPGDAADAAAVGEELTDLKSAIEQIEPGLSGNAKAALLACFRNVAWVSEDGATYYANLESALYGNYPKLIAAFDPGINVIYTDDALDTLKQYLTVTYYATEDSSGVILSPSDYTLSGTLIAGTSSVVVTYQNLSTTVTIPGVVDFYNIWEWNSTYTGAGKLTRTPARASEFTYQGTTKKGILYNTDLIAGNNNRGFATLRGKAPMVTQDNVTLSGFYPIPVPSTATKLTASVTPNTQRLSVMLFQYDPNNQTPAPYSRLGSIAWHTGSQEVTFSAASNLFIAFNCSVDSSFSQYTVEPDMHVLFERS